jgi:hypothetical protein
MAAILIFMNRVSNKWVFSKLPIKI